jgi:hypothetical protein
VQDPDSTTLTLQDAITRRVQYRRTTIDVDLAATLASTTPSQPQTAPGSILPEAQPDPPIRDQLCPSPPWIQSTPLPAYDHT